MVPRIAWLVALGGCASSELLPLVDAEGALAGTYDPAAAALSVDSDAAAAEVSGRIVPLDAGSALVDGLAPGDAVSLLDAAGDPLEVLTVGPSDAAWSDDDVSSRYAACD